MTHLAALPPKYSFWKKIRCYFREYCNCTSIHGFRYFGEKRTYLERGWWAVTFITTLAGCVYAIMLAHAKWNKSPILVSFATSETPIYKIPFPAVTICPEMKIGLSAYNNSDVLERIKKGRNITHQELSYYRYMEFVCQVRNQKKSNITNIPANKDHYDMNYLDDEFDVHNPLHSCQYNNDDLKCAKYFRRILTDDGICFTTLTYKRLVRRCTDMKAIMKANIERPTTNVFDSNQDGEDAWDMDTGYSKSAPLETEPWRALAVGINNAFIVELVTPKNYDDPRCRSLTGYKVTLHTPAQVPKPNENHFIVPLNQIVFGQISPKMIETSDAVKAFAPERRHCFVAKDRRLEYFKSYTQPNCKLECLANLTKEKCDCVAFYMPRNHNTSICGPDKKMCVKNLTSELTYYEVNSNWKHKDTEQVLLDKCNCLPSCNDISYDVYLSQSPWDWERMFTTEDADYKDLDPKQIHMSKLILYFKSPEFVSYRRHEFYGPTDFLANFGGLLGLFTGFSVLSAMEVLYFLTLRIFCNVRLYGLWYGPGI